MTEDVFSNGVVIVTNISYDFPRFFLGAAFPGVKYRFRSFTKRYSHTFSGTAVKGRHSTRVRQFAPIYYIVKYYNMSYVTYMVYVVCTDLEI